MTKKERQQKYLERLLVIVKKIGREGVEALTEKEKISIQNLLKHKNSEVIDLFKKVHKTLQKLMDQEEAPVKVSLKRKNGGRKKETKLQIKGKAPAIVGIILLVGLCLLSFLAFFLSPEAQGVGEQAMISIARPLAEGNDSTEEKPSCGDGITMLELDKNGNLKEVYPERDNPYPVLTAQPQLFCVELISYTAFINVTGTVPMEDGGVRQITGLDWLAETIVYAPSEDGKNWGHLLSEVKDALELVIPDKNRSDLSWIELPGTEGEELQSEPQPQPKPQPQPDWGDPDSDGSEEVPVVQTPTPTPIPEGLIFPDIPVEPAAVPVQTTDPDNWYTQNCDLVLWGNHEIDSMSTMGQIWQMTDEIAVIPNGANVVGVSIEPGNSGKNHSFCVENVTGIPVNKSVVYLNGITAFPTYNRIRSRPSGGLVGYGDELNIFNGSECFVKDMWIGNCSIQYPIPTAVPPGLPTSVPTATPAPQETNTYSSIVVFVNEYMVPNGISIVRYCGSLQGLIGFGNDCTNYVNMSAVSSSIVNFPSSSWIAHCDVAPLGERGVEIGRGYCSGPTSFYP